MEREVRYCTTEDGVRIAYCVEGVMRLADIPRPGAVHTPRPAGFLRGDAFELPTGMVVAQNESAAGLEAKACP